MQSSWIREASKACCLGCCPNCFPVFPKSQAATSGIPSTAAVTLRYEFEVSTVSSLYPHFKFTNHESLPSFEESLSYFNKVYPQYSQTDEADKIRALEYHHLSISNYVCLDYVGHCLFSYSQLENQCPGSPVTSSSPPLHSLTLESVFFNISHMSVNLNSQLKYGSEESEFQCHIRKRIMAFMNISETDYNMVFTANHSAAFKLIAEFYPFLSSRNLLTVYDHQSEAVEVMIESSKKRGANVMSASFSWPNLQIYTENLRKKMVSKSKRKKKGLFVFPLQSRVTGSRYSYLWMSLARENRWHVLLDASALGAKDMDTLGLSLFNPDFLICSFFKVFGENPSGFCCLFVKKSSALVLKDSATSTNVGIVNLVPAPWPTRVLEKPAIISGSKTEPVDEFPVQASFSGPLSETGGEVHNPEGTKAKKKTVSFSEIEEVIDASFESGSTSTTHHIKNRKPECRSLDHADSLGMMKIKIRTRNLINWLVNALMSLQHPHSETGVSAVRIYGPKVDFDRGPAVAFNVFDWKGEKIDPALVQKLADRNNISLSVGILQHIWFSDKHEEEKVKASETVQSKKSDELDRGVSVVTAAVGFLTNFGDVYKVWTFVSRFLDADFLEKETRRYKAINQETVEI
ncbi:hydroxymethylglutaryl-CoA synthase [Hibiscus syriacus]|uniref:Hydroxymethylglutaryl-CoA synthase n=1 Tax=Hibiscus syriacus TaxID=106335 RepID=A0A6A2WN62_HIBSY|nr:molybdenum cofactor sulfurase-like [Hibiscus syriacus]KAE8661803.1 hydroxymethylglutaryl-CoA synthase [Hibiscus syriacus]